MQALILAGGEGTRLRPLTTTIPKPVVPLAGRPHIAHMIDWLARHGVDDVILACGFMADGIRRVLDDAGELGVRLRYIEEPRPLGTGGALKFAERWLEQRFLMLNGDVLADLDLTAQLAQHEANGALATLALVAVDDPSAYGLVRIEADRSVSAFIEKPGPEQLAANLINAGAYVLERDVLDGMAPAGTSSSIERDVFPTLVGRGLYGYPADGYWLDIGTPERFLQATFDILENNVVTAVGERLNDASRALVDGATVSGRVVAPALIGQGSTVGQQAVIGGRAVLGRDVRVAEGAHVESSVVLDGVSVGARSTISSSIIGPRVQIGERCQIHGGVVLGEGVKVGAGNVLAAGARIFPGVELPEGAIRF